MARQSAATGLASALRSLAHARGLAIATIVTIAIGVGALTTVFTMAHAAILRAPPFPDVERLALLYFTRTTPTSGTERERWSYPRLQALRQRVTTFDLTANYTPASGLALTGTDDTEPLRGEFVSPSYFRLLGARAIHGRLLLDEEDVTAGAHPVVVLNEDLWRRRYGSDRDVVGRPIGVNGVQLTVVGVMQSGVRGLSDNAQLWIPATMAPRLTYAGYLTTNQNFISVIGRRAAGVGPDRVAAELQVLGAQVAAMQPEEDPDTAMTRSAVAVPLNEARVDSVTRRGLLLLLGAVALLHVLACINVTSLLLGRAVHQRHEAAVRSALGSSAARLFRWSATQTVVLVAAGGALGALIAAAASAVVSVPSALWGPRNFYGSVASFADVVFDARSLGFAVALTVVSALLIAMAPALTVSRVRVTEGLRDGTRGGSAGTGGLRRVTVRGVIVIAETALAVVLLIAGALLVDSFRRLRATDIGIDARQVITFAIRPSEVRVPPEKAPAFISQLLDAIRSVPGVEAVSVDGGAPVIGSARSVLFVQGRPVPAPDQAPPVHRHYVAPDHFRTLGIPLLRGRAFTDADRAGSPKVTIISASAARDFWPGEDPIGQRVWFGGGSAFNSPDSSAEIVGIVGDVVYEPLTQARNPHSFYTPYTQFTYAYRMVLVRARGEPEAVIPAIRRAVHGVDPDVPLTEIQRLDDRIASTWSRNRSDALLFGGFALLALLLSASGIYAVVSYAVSQRTREMGVRLALGSSPAGLLRLIIGEGMLYPIAGLSLGMLLSVLLSGVLRASLYGVAPTDPRIFTLVVTLLLGVAISACAIPARRAARVDPVQSLRTD
jgi:putative ABC transport system permease protein